ncbi:hypothetical protein VTL71DRAFT_11834 [Oculimacula yallundae]|uniref:Uncharacterized protein n=1 Tax=Oculimacula yallundae TaxID=86028 RepID=A0ABR4CR91_9HELO
MPKFPKGFGRRKSTANELDVAQEASASEPSFKVFERDDGASRSFDGGKKFAKSPTMPLRPKTSAMDDDNMFESIYNRDSGASNTNTISTTDNSSRLSAASTAPSSTDLPRRDEWKSPHDKPFNDIPLPPIPKSASAFSLKNAGRTLSWGRHSKGQTPPPPVSKEPESPIVDGDQSGRQRAVTASSYASTATPPKLDDRDLGLSLGGDFSDMFNGIGKRRSAVLEAETNRAMSRSPDAGPSGPATRSLTPGRFNQPSPLHIDKNKQIEPSPYSWSSQHSHEGLMSGASPVFAPRNTPPPVPQHNTAPRTTNDNPVSHSRAQRPGGPLSGLRRSSAVMEPKRQSTLEYGDAIDEDARLLRESITASRRMNDPSYESKVRDSWALPSDSGFKVDDATIASWGTGSVDATPKARKPAKKLSDDNMFDVQIAASANLAQRFNERASQPAKQTAPQNKVMTPAQFERYKQDQERQRSNGGPSKDEGEDEEEEPYDDDEDEAEKNKQLAKQRRKQEAHMAVYRQQMMKVTGEALPPARPNVFATQSSPNLANGDEGEEEDEEVPLAILQAHGFPNKGKQPMRNMSSNPNLRSGAQSSAGGVVSADSRLPVFARNLPQDPYVGAGLVNPMHRESLSFGGGAGSVNGGTTPRGLPPGGLVGVIATEERSRAMRRGSPNPQGDYGPPQNGGFNPMGMQPPSGGSMYNGMGPGGPMGPMNPMMMTAGDQAQIQMSQQMQQFMQMQMQFMQMMTAGGQGQQPNGHMPSQSMSEMPRPGSAQQMRPGSSHNFGQHQRTMTMLDPNTVPWMQGGGGSMYSPSVHGQGGYTPSIAPSERSNVGLPGRYRPVSHAPPQAQDNKARATTMSALGWGNKNAPTIKTVKKTGNVSDEDDEEGWEEMAKKREKKKSAWRTKKDKDHNGLKEMMGYSQ